MTQNFICPLLSSPMAVFIVKFNETFLSPLPLMQCENCPSDDLITMKSHVK